MVPLGLCVFPVQNDKSSTPGLKSNTPTPRNDAPTPGTSTTPGLRSMPGKPPGMDPIGIMGRHDRAGTPVVEGRAGAAQRGQSPGECVGAEAPPRVCLWGTSQSGFRRKQTGVSTLMFRFPGATAGLGICKELQRGQDTHGLFLPLF